MPASNNGITDPIARELAPRHITCNVVAPGPIVTAMTVDMPAEWRDQIENAVPLGRFGTPEECAERFREIMNLGVDRFLILTRVPTTDPSEANSSNLAQHVLPLLK